VASDREQCPRKRRLAEMDSASHSTAESMAGPAVKRRRVSSDRHSDRHGERHDDGHGDGDGDCDGDSEGHDVVIKTEGTEMRSKAAVRTTSLRAAKFKTAIAVLREFAAAHSGKLPSLRFMMKMLKVGFPKAHEIKKQFADKEGVSIEHVTELMTVRQENNGKEKESKAPTKPKRARKRNPKLADGDKESVCDRDSASLSDDTASAPSLWSLPTLKTEAHSVAHSEAESVGHSLSALLDAVAESGRSVDFSVRIYLRRIVELEAFVSSKVEGPLSARCALSDRENVGSAFFALSEAFYGYSGRHEVAKQYARRALAVFEATKESEAAFWREIVSALLLRGQMLREEGRFAAALRDLERVGVLLATHGLDAGDGHKYRRRHTVHRIYLLCAQREYRRALPLCRKLVSELESQGLSSSEAKAWYSCTLMLCADTVDEGYAMYIDLVAESERLWAAQSERRCSADSVGLAPPYRWWTYFAVHFIRRRQWAESYQLMVKMVQFDHGEQRAFNAVATQRAFALYIEFLAESPLTAENKDTVNALMMALHPKHVEAVGMLRDRRRTGKWRDVEGTEGVEERFAALRCPAEPRMATVLESHILIFRRVGNVEFAEQIATRNLKERL